MSPRREYTYAKLCNTDGCREAERMVFDTQREYMDFTRFRTQFPYLCMRHKRPEEVVSKENPIREIVYTVIDDSSGKRWAGPYRYLACLGGGTDDYQAYASDFPVGTRLRITVAID